MSEVFLRDFGEVCHRRFDAEYHKDEFVELEQIIRKKTNLKLSDFILSISSGATPDKKESWKYYTEDKTKGIPFLRVQNIKPNTTISDDFIYINAETHEGMLKRSQVNENDLIITITGRLGTAAVAPKGFVGNINQHSVVIKTKDLQTSRAIATFLNTDIGEKLANRRATGGTRPALDYKALKSIPIVYNEQIYPIVEEANRLALQKEQQAKGLLDSIDEYLLDELGIVMPAKSNNTLENRIFMQSFSNISDTRFDPNYHQKYYQDLEKALENGKYSLKTLGKITTLIASGSTPKSKGEDYEKNGKYYFLRLVNFDSNFGIDLQNALFVKEYIYNGELSRVKLKYGDILFGIAGSLGKVAQYNYNFLAVVNQAIAILRFKEDILSEFVLYVLYSCIVQYQITRLKRPVAQPNINTQELKSVIIPLPPLAVQEQIVREINKRIERAKTLQQEAKEILESAKKQVESIILGG